MAAPWVMVKCGMWKVKCGIENVEMDEEWWVKCGMNSIFQANICKIWAFCSFHNPKIPGFKHCQSRDLGQKMCWDSGSWDWYPLDSGLESLYLMS